MGCPVERARYAPAILVAFLASCTSVRDVREAPPAIRGVTLRGDTVSVHPDGAGTFVVLYNGYACRDCFTFLDEALRAIYLADTRVHCIVLARAGTSTMARRTVLSDIAGVMPSRPSVLFEIISPGIEDAWPPANVQGGIFGRFDVAKTPSLVVAQRDSLIYIPYDSLFAGLAGLRPDEVIDSLVHRLKSIASIEREGP